ncbi:hypothetical protein [Nostocoides sp. Soil756]|uniref:hypothetical protein n=1 Tax=Nostocoides sp. Soil756 TaxID=1736399 RepID=UPI0007011503|nr:hypothetical protein [Tetrasphaera sp. Soil756]KRE61574.1 hypothetical protein ASG78_09430 [Tetrasphaera sp. Soil756]
MRLLIAALAGVAVSASACGGSPAPAVTVTEAAPTVAATPTTAEPTPNPSTAEPVETKAAPETFTMPKLVGQNLQLAQDILQKQGSYLIDQQDAAGLGRIQVNDSNWKVCTQEPKAGAETPIETVVVLASVKLDETCP